MTALRLASSVLAATAATVIGLSAPATASEKDRKFFSSVEGSWSGPGEIVAGKYKGTKFVCNFTGATPGEKVGMSLDGGCRVGLLFDQHQRARLDQFAVGAQAVEEATAVAHRQHRGRAAHEHPDALS